MELLKFFSERKALSTQDFQKLYSLGLPYDMFGFYAKYDPCETKAAEWSCGLCFEDGGERVLIDLNGIDELMYYELDFEGYVYKEPLVWLAKNNTITEGAVFIDIETGWVYSFLDEPDRVPASQRRPIAKSFSGFLQRLRLCRGDDEQFLL